MEKINKEELMKKLNLTEEELEKVAGGVNWQCFVACMNKCYEANESPTQVVGVCLDNCCRTC